MVGTLKALGKKPQAKALGNEITVLKNKYKKLPEPSSRMPMSMKKTFELVNKEKERAKKEMADLRRKGQQNAITEEEDEQRKVKEQISPLVIVPATIPAPPSPSTRDSLPGDGSPQQDDSTQKEVTEDEDDKSSVKPAVVAVPKKKSVETKEILCTDQGPRAG